MSKSFKRGLMIGLLLLNISLLLAACTTSSPDAERLTVGEGLYRLIVGGPSISEVTLIRFYAWHVIALPIPMLALIVWHGFRVRRDGGVSSPERQSVQESKPERLDRRMIVRKETLTFFVTIASVILISVFVNPAIGPAAEIGALTEHSQAPWIFLWVQELLRIWPPAIAGVLIPMLVMLLMSLTPYMDWSNDGIAVWFNKQGRLAQIVLVMLLVVIIGLTIRAGMR